MTRIPRASDDEGQAHDFPGVPESPLVVHYRQQAAEEEAAGRRPRPICNSDIVSFVVGAGAQTTVLRPAPAGWLSAHAHSL